MSIRAPQSPPSRTAQSIYDTLVWRIVCALPGNAREDIGLQRYLGVLTPEEIDVVVHMHRDAVSGEFKVDPSWITRHLKGEITTDHLITHLRDMTERVVCEAIRDDVLKELEFQRDASMDTNDLHRPSYGMPSFME